MSERRRVAPSMLLTLTLILLPGWALAGGRRAPAPASAESPFAFLLDWAVRGWESLAHRSPASPASASAPSGSSTLDHAVARAGCGIDPNGTGCN